MKRIRLKKKLLDYGYSEDMIKKLFQGRSQPTAKKMFELKDKYNIPLNAWRDIKSYLKDDSE